MASACHDNPVLLPHRASEHVVPADAAVFRDRDNVGAVET
jgi:hypothetical protein